MEYKNKKGWKIYKEITENNADLDETWRGNDIEKEWENWSKIVNKILKVSLGNIRITEKNRQGIDNEVREMMQEKKKNKKRNKQYRKSRKQKCINNEKKRN